MSTDNCSQEAAVTRAARSGHWDDALQAHAAECVNCSEVVRTVSAMQSLAGPIAGSPLPSSELSADLLWRKALLEQKRAEAARARRPWRIAQYVSWSVVALACAAWLAWSWSSIEPSLNAWPDAVRLGLLQGAVYLVDGSQALGAASLIASSAGIGSGGLAPFAGMLLLIVAATLAAYPLLAED